MVDGGLISSEDLRKVQSDIAKELDVDLYWGDDDALLLRKLPIGLAPFDAVLDGGMAYGRFTLLIGDYSTGKTVLALMMAKAVQAQGEAVVYIDAERVYEPEWAKALGVDIEKLMVVRPPHGERAFDVMLELVRKRVGLIIIDSIEALRPKARQELKPGERMEQKYMGDRAKMVNEGLAELIQENKGTMIIGINQIRYTIGGYGNPETQSGGAGQQFYAWQKIRVRRGALIEEGTGVNKVVVGQIMKIKAEKNKQGAPFKTAEVPFYYTGKFDEIAALVDYAIERGVLERKGAFYSYPDEEGEIKKAQGKAALADVFRESDKLLKWLKDNTHG